MTEIYSQNPHDLLSIFAREFNASQVLRDISTYWNFRSTVPGTGLKAASEFLCQRYVENGIQAELLSYPADDQTEYLDGRKNPLAWTPRSARLEIVAPEEHVGLICTYDQEPLCLISNSTATHLEGVRFEIVVLNSGAKEKDYADKNVAGKVILTDAWPLQVDKLARKYGALGIISDGVTPPWLYNHPPVRRAADVPDLTMWGILDGHRNEKPLWGFSLSPRQGAHLRQLIQENGSKVRLKAVVDAELKKGTSEVVSAYIPGKDLAGEEIWLLAHSSEPGALDNASGCCASVEIARCLTSLIKQGVLPAPRRSIRFLHAVEVAGFLPFVTEKMAESVTQKLDHVKAAIAFDSIGQDFRKGGGSLRVFRSPEANPTYADSLIEELIDWVSTLPNTVFRADNYEAFNWQAGPHFPGNDNFLADGFFDVPTPMLCNWPDKHYHSNLDTVDKLSPGSLGRAAVVSAVYVHTLANADTSDALWMASLTLRDYKKRILDKPEKAGELCKQGQDALISILRLEDIRETAEDFGRSLHFFSENEGREPAGDVVWGPPSQLENHWIKPTRWSLPPTENFSNDGSNQLQFLMKEHPTIGNLWELLNGRRTVRDLCKRSSISNDAVADFIGLLLSEELVTLTPIPREATTWVTHKKRSWVENDKDLQIEIKPSAKLAIAEKEAKDQLMRLVFKEGLSTMVWAATDWEILLWSGGKLVSHIDIVDRTAHVGDQNIRIGGIGGVCTLPEFRNRGLARLCLTHAAIFMQQEMAVDFGLLFCEEKIVPFYSKLNWKSITAPVTYEQPKGKVKLEGVAMYLACKRTQWPSGDVDVNGLPW